MLGRENYTRQELDHVKASLHQQPSAYKKLADPIAFLIVAVNMIRAA